MNTGLIVVSSLIVALSIALFIFYIVYKKRAEQEQPLTELLQMYIAWNNSITTKQGMVDFYTMLGDMYKNVWNTDFKMQITKEEFDQLPIETLKQLNEQALNDLIDQLKQKGT